MIELEDADICKIMDEMTHDGYLKYSQIECILRVRDWLDMTEQDSIKAINILKDLGIKESTAITNTNIIDFSSEHRVIPYHLEYDNTICMTIYESPLDYAAKEGLLYVLWKENELMTHQIEDDALLKIRQYVEMKPQHVINIHVAI